MVNAYEPLPEYPQDSPQWHEARRQGIGASEVAAILGLSAWQTPLDVYRAKMGVPNEIPENLAYFGHALEQPIAAWIEHKHPEVGGVWPGIGARSVEWPWLTATPDRVTTPDPVDFEPMVPIELKTSSAYSKDKWRDGVPLYYQAQVQTQLAVLGAPCGWLAVLHGGNDPELYRVDRDDTFITDILVPRTKEFWEDHVLAHVPPEPSTLGEQALVWPTTPDSTVELSETAYEAFQRRNVLLSDIRAQQAEADELQKVLGSYVQTAETLTYEGRPVATYKTQRGRITLDHKALTADHPEIASRYERRGQDFKVLRTIKEKMK